MIRRTPTTRAFATALAFAAVFATAAAVLVSPASAHGRHHGHHHNHYYQYHDFDDAPYSGVVYRRHHRGIYAPYGFAHTYGRRIWVRAPFVNIYIRN
ncbi:MAG: hypothetical protein WC807_00210 [Hyphomicrobium sp.]|jgi:hypothetical protein